MSTQLIELIILFAIAAFVLFRLKSVIGTRTGYEAPPDYLKREGATAPGHPRPRPVADVEDEEESAVLEQLPERLRETIEAMHRADPDFTLPAFLEGARAAYEMILMAYESGDRASLRELLAPEVFEAFEQRIAEREAKGLHVDARFIGVRELRIENATFDAKSHEADITVRFVGELITAVRDAEGRIVEGDPNEIHRQTDVWTFSRRLGTDDPTWLLTATGE